MNSFILQSQVQAHVFNRTADAQLTANREKRLSIWADLNAAIVDKTAVATASLEHLARSVRKNLNLNPNQIIFFHAYFFTLIIFQMLLSTTFYIPHPLFEESRGGR